MSSSLRELRDMVDDTIAGNLVIAPGIMMMPNHQILSEESDVQPQCRPKTIAPKIINNWTTSEEEIILSGYLSHEPGDDNKFYQPLKFNEMKYFDRDWTRVLLLGECMDITLIYIPVDSSVGISRLLQIRVHTIEGDFVAQTFMCRAHENDNSKYECIDMFGSKKTMKKNGKFVKQVVLNIEILQIESFKCIGDKCHIWSVTLNDSPGPIPLG